VSKVLTSTAEGSTEGVTHSRPLPPSSCCASSRHASCLRGQSAPPLVLEGRPPGTCEPPCAAAAALLPIDVRSPCKHADAHAGNAGRQVRQQRLQGAAPGGLLVSSLLSSNSTTTAHHDRISLRGSARGMQASTPAPSRCKAMCRTAPNSLPYQQADQKLRSTDSQGTYRSHVQPSAPTDSIYSPAHLTT
jgi:hypothetical protein